MKQIKTPLALLLAASMALPMTACHRHKKDYHGDKPFVPQTTDAYNQDSQIANNYGGGIPWWFWFYHPGYTSYNGHYSSSYWSSRPGNPVYTSSHSGWFSSLSSSNSSKSSSTSRGGFGGSSGSHGSSGE